MPIFQHLPVALSSSSSSAIATSGILLLEIPWQLLPRFHYYCHQPRVNADIYSRIKGDLPT